MIPRKLMADTLIIEPVKIKFKPSIENMLKLSEQQNKRYQVKSPVYSTNLHAR